MKKLPIILVKKDQKNGVRLVAEKVVIVTGRFFKSNILCKFSTAIEMKSYEIIPVVNVVDIKRKTNGRSWSGKGFLGTDDLKNYSICGRSVAEYFKGIANKILTNEIRC